MENESTVNRYRIFRRKSGIYFLEDNKTGKQESLRIRDRNHAESVAFARNESDRITAGHRQIGIGYLQAGDPKIRTRKWSDVAEAFCAQPVKESMKCRKLNAMKDPALRPLLPLVLIETTAEHLLGILAQGTVSTNCYLRKLHNLAKKLKWLPEEILTRGTWPVIRYKEKRAITHEEHERILAVTPTEERRRYHTHHFVESLRQAGVEAHAALVAKRYPMGIVLNAVSQRIRKRIGEIFGWIKTTGGLRKSCYRGVARTHAAGQYAVVTLNLLRLARRQAA